MTTPRILIDRNLEVHALTAEPAAQTREFRWGPTTINSTIYGYRGKALPAAEWPRRQLEALPTIARLARDGHLVFCTSTEVRFEAFNAAARWQGFCGDLFRDIQYEHVPAAVERSNFFRTLDSRRYASGETQADWYRDWLLKVDEKRLLTALEGHVVLPDFDQRNQANLSRFREICSYLDTDDHIRDAFHLWTAEVNQLDYFLTEDKSFVNKMTLSTPLSLPTPPISPAELLEILGIKDLDPLPLADRLFRDLFDEDC